MTNPMKTIKASIIGLFYRGSKRSLKRPFFESPVKKSNFNTCFACPLRQMLGFSMKSNFSSYTTIKSLFSWSRPSAIFFAVVSIVRYTVNSRFLLSKISYMFKVRFVHIVLELFKRVPLTFYTLASIILKTNMFAPIATIPQIAVYLVKARLSHSMIIGREFTSDTITTLCLATFVNNVMTWKHFLVSAITLKKPIIFGSTSTHKLYRYQLPKLLPSNIFHIVLPLQARRIGRSVPTVAPMLLISPFYTA